ncbi:MAG: VanZ family protein [Candidatus Aenigmarchaeota archaeon]
MKLEFDRKFYVYLSLVVLETFVLLWFSFSPSVDFVRTDFPLIRLGDLEHFIAYGIYGFLLGRVFKYFFSGKKSVLLSLVIGSFMGGLCEISQYFLPYRVGDVIDWIIDTFGSLVGGFINSRFKPFS